MKGDAINPDTNHRITLLCVCVCQGRGVTASHPSPEECGKPVPGSKLNQGILMSGLETINNRAGLFQVRVRFSLLYLLALELKSLQTPQV